jgi:hypothetical protein
VLPQPRALYYPGLLSLKLQQKMKYGQTPCELFPRISSDISASFLTRNLYTPLIL